MYALGLALSLPPAPLEPDLESAAGALQEAHEAAPERWWIEVDLAELVYDWYRWQKRLRHSRVNRKIRS